jgi:hypothetical protein
LITDNGYLAWSCTIPSIKSSSSEAEIRFSQWIESLRKDVECTFGILKGRSKHAEDNTCLCSFLINIKYDEFGFYLVGGRGQGCHNNHPRLLPAECRIPLRLMDPEEKNILHSIGVAKAN